MRMTIGQLVKETGANEERIRRFVALGLIPAKRPPIKGSHRRFSRADLPKIRKFLSEAGVIEDYRAPGSPAERDTTGEPALVGVQG